MISPTYFLSFLWRRAEADFWIPIDTVSAEHPVDFISRARRTGAPKNEYRLLFFKEIPFEVYERNRPGDGE